MSIRRCPYCKAIIDESQKYCNNCGTQLLFPEDESAEEDLKGEKIVDEEFKDEEEFEKSLEPSEENEDRKEEIDLEDILEGGAAFPGEEKKKMETPEEEFEAKEEFVEKESEEAAETLAVEEKEARAPAGDKPPEELEEEPGEKEEAEEREEKKDAVDTREDIVRLIAALEKKQKKAALSKEEERILAPIEEAGSMPAWADLAGGKAVSEIFDEEAGEKTEGRSFASGDTMDFEEEVMRRAGKVPSPRSTMGIPETVTKGKSAFLFDRDTSEKEIPGTMTEETERDVYGLESRAIRVPRARLGFFGRLKAVLFDLMFVTVLWLGAVWPASRLMAVPLKAFVTAVPVSLGLFYLVLLVGYFFMFFFFLGETLGGRLASSRD